MQSTTERKISLTEIKSLVASLNSLLQEAEAKFIRVREQFATTHNQA